MQQLVIWLSIQWCLSCDLGPTYVFVMMMKDNKRFAALKFTISFTT